MPKGKGKREASTNQSEAKAYRHTGADSPLRPDVGTQAQFRKKKPPVTYRYDSSLSPALDWDGQNPVRELGEWLIAMIEQASALPAPHTFDKPQEFKNSAGQVVASVRGLPDAIEQLKRLGKPFLNWAGKTERLSFDVPTLPLFVHERLSTKAIIETLKGHKKQEGPKQLPLFELFGDPQRPVTDQVLKAYEYRDKWVNRLILGDSLVVMNSLQHYEGLGGQVQMIYMDPPYGIKFGSNFQPFVRKRDVAHNDDEDMTREPEMVKAYRDTWELGLHSYLTYMRDRLLLARDLLSPTGSVFVQISDENVHHVREIMDEVFGKENFVSIITFRKKTGPLGGKLLQSICDYILWYAKDKNTVKFHRLFEKQVVVGDPIWSWVELQNGRCRKMTREEIDNHSLLPKGAKVFQSRALSPAGFNATATFNIEYEGKLYQPPGRSGGNSWATNYEGMQQLIRHKRVLPAENTLRYVYYLADFPFTEILNIWSETRGAIDKFYVVQTDTTIIERCLLMTTDPGDLVLDPTCVREGTLILTPEAAHIPTPLNPPVNGGKLGININGRRLDIDVNGERLAVPATGGKLSVPAKVRIPGNPERAIEESPSPFTGRAGVGLTPIESLKPGDYVYSHDGKPHQVIRTIKRRYHGAMFGIRHKLSRHTLWLTADHPALVKTRRHAFTKNRDWGHVPNTTFAKARTLRKEMTPYERKLWSKLRNEQLGVKFRRQHPVGSYIADFYCAERSLIVEVDGNSHFSDAGTKHDAIRTEYMRTAGLGVLRFTNRDIQTNLNGVVERISMEIGRRVENCPEDTVWLMADKLQPGDTVFYGVDLTPVEITEILHEETTEYVYDLEVEGAHSFMTHVCAVHNCGSGTTAYVAEQWGRRWITIDTSRVPLALARQRLLTATFPYYELKDEARGPAGGFIYKRKQNNKGEEIGGIVPHVTLKSIANNEPPAEEVLVDRPEIDNKIIRVAGPFCVEATIPTPVDWEGDGVEDSGAGAAEQHGSFIDRMLEILRKSPVLHVGGGKSVILKNIRPPARTLSLSAEAIVMPADMTTGKTTPLNPPVNGGRLDIDANGGNLDKNVNKGRSETDINGWESEMDANGEKKNKGINGDEKNKGVNKEKKNKCVHGEAKKNGVHDGELLVSEPEPVSVPISVSMEVTIRGNPEGVIAEPPSPFTASAGVNSPSPFTGRAGVGEPVALLFGPENGAVSEKLVHEALKEANLRGYTHLYVIGVGIQSNARMLIENAVNMGMLPATYVQATPDIMMGDLLKNMRSSQIFSVCGQPEVKIHTMKSRDKSEQLQYQAEILGLDVLDPVSMKIDKRKGDDVPAWFLDTDYNGLCFHACQAFFPRTGAWDNLKRALKGSYEESVWEHLAGTKSVPFVAGEHGQIAIKVIDDRGNELMVVKRLTEG